MHFCLNLKPQNAILNFKIIFMLFIRMNELTLTRPGAEASYNYNFWSKNSGNNYPVTRVSNCTVVCIDDEMGETCGTHGRKEISTQNFYQSAWSKDNL